MGIGLINLGYLVAFLIEETCDRLGFGMLALIFGGVIMLYGLIKLVRFEPNVKPALFVVPVLLLCGVYQGLDALDRVFGWQSPLFGDGVDGAFALILFLAFACLHVTLFAGLRTLCLKVELKTLSALCLAGNAVVCVYAVCYLFLGAGTPWEQLTFHLLLAYTVILLLRCTKNIAPAEEPEPKEPTGIIGKLNRALNEKEDMAVQKTYQEAMEKLERREAVRQSKKEKNKK